MLALPANVAGAEAPAAEPVPAGEDAEREVRLYRTNAERREIGAKRALTPWLTLSGLLELESLSEEIRVAGDANNEGETTGAATVQLGLVATPWDELKAELVLEVDSETGELFVEEAIASLDLEPWELEAGVFYLPFGEYISHFASGPLLEFGETRAPAATLSYGPDERLDISVALYRGRARRQSTGSRPVGWAAAVEAWPTDSLLVGASYLSNLADAEQRLLADVRNRYRRRVPGVAAYLVWTEPEFEVTLEGLGATRRFAEFDADRDQPLAWNLEFVRFARPDFEWALRLEGSRELEGEPELQYGAAITWRPLEQAGITLEYLRGTFARGFATNDDDAPLYRVDRFGTQISIAF